MNENFKLDIRKRPRRLRKSNSILELCAETRVSPSDLILPVFVKEGSSGSEPIPSMPHVARHTVDSLLRACEAALRRGVAAIAPFPMVEPSAKSLHADEAANPKSLANRAIAAVKKNFPEISIFADIALDPYTTHGHDGILGPDGQILNDETVEVLAAMALVAAQSGADFVAPSDMMDGRIGAIRTVLDDCDFTGTGIMAYSAKYASAFYGPFREAAGSTPAFGDRRSYQMDPRNVREALREAELDIDEGADMIMVKPGLPYLDVLSKVKEAFDVPTGAYCVSGEYSMIKAAAANGWLDEERVVAESAVCLARAGADIIVTYFAPELAKMMKEGRL